MPFVIRFHTCNLDPEPGGRPDPLTRVMVPFEVERGLTALEKLAVIERLRLTGGVGPDAFGRYRVYFPGGGVAEAAFPNLGGEGRCTEGTLVAAEPFERLLHLAFELARAGNLLLVPDGVRRPLVPTEEQRQRVVRRWVTVLTVPTAAGLWRLVAPPPPEGPPAEPPPAEPAGEPPPGEEVP